MKRNSDGTTAAIGVGVGVGVGVIVGVGLMVGEIVGLGDGLFMTTRRGEIVPQAAMSARMLNIHIGIQWLLPPCERRFISKKDAHNGMAVAVAEQTGQAAQPIFVRPGTKEKTRFAQFC